MLAAGAVGIVNIDPKRRGYSHNVLIPRLLDWVMHLAKLVICIAVILSIPCSPWGPQKLNTIDGGPKVLFNATYPDGVPLPSGNIDSMAAGALHLAVNAAQDLESGQWRRPAEADARRRSR